MECHFETEYASEPKHRQKVNYYRELRGLTQKELAARPQTVVCDLTESMLGKIEIGYRATSVYEIDKRVEVLHVDYNALFA